MFVGGTRVFLDPSKTILKELKLQKNDIKTFDNRFLKFDTDYKQYTFYEPSFDNSGNTVAPYNTKSIHGSKLLNVDFTLSDQITYHER